MYEEENLPRNNYEIVTDFLAEHDIETDEERNTFLKEHISVMTDAGELVLSEQAYYEEPIGETVYNSYTNVLYVFPDRQKTSLLRMPAHWKKPLLQNTWSQ